MWDLTKEVGPIRCPETSVNNYNTKPRNIPEERRSHQHRGGSLKSNRLFDFHEILYRSSSQNIVEQSLVS